MSERTSAGEERVASPVPRGGWLAMGLILLVIALVSLYANVQNARRDQIEKVTVIPAPAVNPTPAGSPAAAAP